MARGSLWVEKCLKLVSNMEKNALAAPFLYPVSKMYEDLPGYFDLIKYPMDLSTVKKRLRRKHYGSLKEFGKDMRLIWANAKEYNDEGSEVHGMAEELGRQFEEKFRELEKGAVGKKKKAVVVDIEEEESKAEEKKKKKRGRGKKQKRGRKREEKFPMQKMLSLADMIKKLKKVDLMGVWKILAKYNDDMKGKSEIEVNFDKLSTPALKELYKYAESKTQPPQAQQVKNFEIDEKGPEETYEYQPVTDASNRLRKSWNGA